MRSWGKSSTEMAGLEGRVLPVEGPWLAGGFGLSPGRAISDMAEIPFPQNCDFPHCFYLTTGKLLKG